MARGEEEEYQVPTRLSVTFVACRLSVGDLAGVSQIAAYGNPVVGDFPVVTAAFIRVQQMMVHISL